MVIKGGKVRKRTWRFAGRRRESWGWTITVDGKQIRRQGWTSKAEAENALDDFKEELRNPEPEPKPTLTLAQAFERYFKKKEGDKKRSLPEDRRLGKRLQAEFGKDTLLAAITTSRITEYKEKLSATKSRQTGEPLSAASINRPLALLRHLLRIAHEEWEVLEAVPRIKLKREPEGRLRWLNPDEARRLLVACGESKNPDLGDIGVDVVHRAPAVGSSRADLGSRRQVAWCDPARGNEEWPAS